MFRILTLAIVVTGSIGMTGCMIVDTPVQGLLGSRVRWGEFAQGDDKDTRKARPAWTPSSACSLGGMRASAPPRPTERSPRSRSIDHSAKNFLNIVGEYCTIVRGK